MSRLFALAFAAPMAIVATPAMAQPADAALVQLVTDFVDAERNFDQPRLAALITSDYAEVSPVGELDLHDAFLGFYAPDKKRPVPVTTISEPLVRSYGDAASIIVRLSFEIPGRDGQPARMVSMRASFLAVRQSGKWKIASAQFTPERPRPPVPPAQPAPPAQP
ncbi:nuclear transport factor 2 family protein [Sphingomonas sp. AOB5]|uniref:YybH family protein n=1 Tax=Sphingomonas sp. AOB5 TaxID=3034017 RepID=UPI0023F717E9|nr:nuclear transport factor 2 family protein [Sphingomonas sp. AOB5]MDF7775249.1 nuclear transport factor 2 family protein [Sphingomonas sp. AOB5]